VTTCRSRLISGSTRRESERTRVWMRGGRSIFIYFDRTTSGVRQLRRYTGVQVAPSNLVTFVYSEDQPVVAVSRR
jgi:hypothetical protein